MFDNIGGKLKTLAKVLTILGVAASIIIGIIVMSDGGAMSYYGYRSGPSSASIVSGLIFMLIGSLGAWLGSFLLYGFGELIEKAQEIAHNTAVPLRASRPDSAAPAPAPSASPAPPAPSAWLSSRLSQVAPLSKAGPASDGWTCPACKRVNPRTSTACKECGRDK